MIHPRTLACGLLLVVLPVGCDSSPVTPTDSGTMPDASAPADAFVPVDAGQPCQGPPGLYVEGSCDVLALGLRSFRPRYQLWSDGSTKDRYIYLPPGTRIDTTDPDRWVFPQGTRIYKTFSQEIGGVMTRLETRLLEKVGDRPGVSSWQMRTFGWNAAQDEVHEVMVGEQDVLGTMHDIPARADCVQCHTGAALDTVNGFGALQLNHELGGVTLRTLLDEGLFTTPIALADAQFPGDQVTQDALGYLHANCGSCHGGSAPQQQLALWSQVGVTNLADTQVFMTAICQCSGFTAGDATLRIDPGSADTSVLVRRMDTREIGAMMPPLATEVLHPEGLAAVRAWIDALDPTANGCPLTCP